MQLLLLLLLLLVLLQLLPLLVLLQPLLLTSHRLGLLGGWPTECL
jgi:hypothetical protein